MHLFTLDPGLAAETVIVADWALSRVLLRDDVRFPWLVLVPRRAGLVEMHELQHAERMVLIEEIARASRGLKHLTGAAKINVGALGNLVTQLHVHVVARTPVDAAWPGPVWGHSDPEPYGGPARDALVAKLRSGL
jgi:diadenosine tetraphosphate (Ap4A) HIT family hydrolase